MRSYVDIFLGRKTKILFNEARSSNTKSFWDFLYTTEQLSRQPVADVSVPLFNRSLKKTSVVKIFWKIADLYRFFRRHFTRSFHFFFFWLFGNTKEIRLSSFIFYTVVMKPRSNILYKNQEKNDFSSTARALKIMSPRHRHRKRQEKVLWKCHNTRSSGKKGNKNGESF